MQYKKNCVISTNMLNNSKIVTSIICLHYSKLSNKTYGIKKNKNSRKFYQKIVYKLIFSKYNIANIIGKQL